MRTATLAPIQSAATLARRRWVPALLLLGLILIPCSAQAQLRLPFVNRVEADPNKPYTLTEADGPWMIMAASFAGPDAPRLAHALVLEVRRELRVPAFVYRYRVEFDDQVEGLGLQLNPVDPGLQPVHPRMRHLNLQDFEEWAVLVGEFDSVEDPKSQKVLERVKNLNPVCFRDFPDASETFRQRELRRHFALQDNRPLRAAFVCPNPLLPDEVVNSTGPDRFVYDLNRDFEFSLLRCPNKYSLKVATFRGDATFNLEEIEEKEEEFRLAQLFDRALESKLDDAMDKAHRLTLALRERGVPAWEYHDRTSSFVCVGGFDELFVIGANGLQVPHPDVTHWLQQFQPQPIRGQLRDARNQVVNGAVKPFTLQGMEDLPFDYTQVPVEVPRYNIANDYAAPRR